MATVVNDRDVLIMSATPRFTVATDRAFFLGPETAVFQVTNGIASPSSFRVTPTLLNMTGTVTYAPSAGISISADNNGFTLNYADMTVSSGFVVGTVVVDGVTYTRTFRVSRVVDGIAPKILDLGASSQVFKVDRTGVGSPGSIELIAYAQNLAGSPNFTISSGTATLAIGSDNTRKQLTFANMQTDLVQITVTQDGQSDTMTIVKVREGQNGVDAVVGLLSNEAQALAADVNGNLLANNAGVETYMQVFLGINDDTSNWTFTASPASNLNTGLGYTWTYLNRLQITGMAASADSANLAITASRPGFPSISKVFSVSKSKTGPMGPAGTGSNGQRGNVNIAVVTSGSGWSDAEANNAVYNFTGTPPRAGDVVNLYRADRTWVQKRVFDGFNWQILAEVFDGAVLVKGSVISDALATGAVTARTIAAGAVVASSLAVGNNDQVLPDSQMLDPTWWGRSPQSFVGSNSFWHSSRILLFAPGLPYQDTFSAFFPVVRGGVYLFEYQCYMTDDYAGPCAVYFHLPGQEWFAANVASRGYSFQAAGIPGGATELVLYDENSPKGTSNPKGIRTINDDANGGQVQVRIITNVTRGAIQIGGFRVTRVMDNVLIADDAITAGKVRAKAISADKMDVNVLSAISNIVTARVGGGAGIDQDANGIRIYDGSGVRRVQLGNLDA